MGALYRSFALSRGMTASAILFFGRAGIERYDSPDNAYGLSYLGISPAGCFIEMCGQTMPRALDQIFVEQRGIATIQATDLKLLDITGHGAYLIGQRALYGPVTESSQGYGRRLSLNISGTLKDAVSPAREGVRFRKDFFRKISRSLQ
jgi:hypothetical protein